MKTSELTGALLDIWVAKAEGWQVLGVKPEGAVSEMIRVKTAPDAEESLFSPSVFWHDGGPIIEREGISPMRWEVPNDAGDLWTARNLTATVHQSGPTALIAAMRTYVASVFGEEVPDDPTVKADKKRNG